MFKFYDFIKNILPAVIILTGSASLHATHNRAGQISIEQVGDCVTSLTVRATITTYTKASSRPADRDTLTICWGDGVCERVARTNGPGSPPQGVTLENDTKWNEYIAVHTYPARGQYVISMTDPNRNGGILNVNPPNSDQIRFHIQTTYTFPNPQFQGCNNTPILLQPPIDIGCVGEVFTHNPNAYDPEGDSLSYHFIIPYAEAGLPVPNYLFPYQISPGPNNLLTIDELTGDIVWDAPRKKGEYNLAMIIVEYREGFPIDTIVRDMQILIEECDNKPPIVETSIDEVCVIAGEEVVINVVATAPLEDNQLVRLTALGGPFEVPYSPATFEPDNNIFEEDPVEKVFRWQTTCEHISDQYYSVVFKAVDNHFGDTTGLATLKTVRIKVLGPPPLDLRADPGSGQVELNWEKPYFCEDAAENYFRGFTVWRREGSVTFQDSCQGGLSGRGYQKLTNVAFTEVVDGRYYYLDNNVERGRTYCYRILAEFAKTTPGGQYTYNMVESLPSKEICVQLSRDVPLLTNVNVLETGLTDGSIGVCWSKPKAEDLDTLLNPGPYRYEVLRATGITENDADFQPIGVDFNSQTFEGANDTCFVDTGLNTVENAYSYKINFYVSGKVTPLGSTRAASSVFLSISPTDNTNILTWTETVPWDNYEYVVFRQNALGDFISIATVPGPPFRDTGLENGREYCYKVQSVGSYGIEEILDPLINNSQKSCSIPEDNVPPCPPEITVENICTLGQGFNCSNVDLVNTIRWINPEELCEETDDVIAYNIYYAPVQGADLTLIARIDDPFTTSFEHRPERGIAGCYAVTALDSMLRNESQFSPIICVDNCPFYELPNAFTPNGDGQNDTFRPFPYCFIESVDFKVFNRWGQLVFEASDPDLNWDGKNMRGEELAEGVYYYSCRVFEQRVGGTIPSAVILKGYIELIRGGRR